MDDLRLGARGHKPPDGGHSARGDPGARLRVMFGRTLAPGLAALSLACNDASGPSVVVTAHVLNGATPATLLSVGMAQPAAGNTAAAAAVPANGYWLLSPDNVSMRIVRVQLTGGPGGNGATVDCTATYSRFNIGLSPLVDCPFPAPAGTYNGVNVVFSSTYSVQISDAANGFYTSPFGVVTTEPAGGAKGLIVTVGGSSANADEISVAIPFAAPLVVSPDTPPSLSVVINGIQFFHVSVTGGVVALGWPGTGYADAFRPDVVASVGSLAKVGFYSAQEINGTGSYCAGNCAAPPPTGVTSVAVYYAGPSQPAMVSTQLNGTPPGCGPFGAEFINSTRSYLGLDSGGNLAWAMPADNTWATYSAELRIAELASLGASTTLYCQNRSTDPAPAGGSYASGAPAIAIAGNSLGTYVLVAK